MSGLEELPVPLLEWFRDNARKLPWRDEPTAYHVLVSEVMLQQTRVAAVLNYYNRFLTEAPDTAALAALPEERLMKLWQGLGYYARARNLQAAARQIMDEHGGVFPSDYQSIRALKGVGDYTAGAICSIAFGQPVPAVDGNVLRVTARLTGYGGDVSAPAAKRYAAGLLRPVIPHRDAGAFTQALMELGAVVCLPNGAPLCEKCPARGFCTAHLEGREGELPVKAPKRPRRIEERTVWLIFYEHKAALRRRPARGLLAGLWEFPNELGAQPPAEWTLAPLTGAYAGQARHIFTHIEWHMTALTVQAASPGLPEGWVWADRRALEQTYAVPSAFDGLKHIVKERIR